MDYQLLKEQLTHILAHFDLNQQSGGGSLSIFHKNKVVIALAHGVANIDKSTQKTTLWKPTTLSLNFSTGKGVLVTLIHVLVSQHFLDYDKPIAQYWASFGQNNKQMITLRDILTHEARLFDIVSITEHAKDMLDWQMMKQKVEKMPINQLSQMHDSEDKFVAYSALVSGWILGGLIEAVTGLSLQQALEKYLLQPLNLVGQVYFGVPPEQVDSVAGQMRANTARNKPVLLEDTKDTLAFFKSLPIYQCWRLRSNDNKELTSQAINSLYFDAKKVNIADYKSALVPTGSRQFNYYDKESLQAIIPAANGVASSIALATLYAMLANRGQWNAKTIIDNKTFVELSQIYNQQPDKVMPATMCWRLGYHRVFSVCHEVNAAFGHMGYNGSMAWCDPSREIAVSYTHNYDVTMLTDVRQFIINETVLDFFDKYKNS